MNTGHAYMYILPAEKYFSTHPEYFSLVKGKRIPDSQRCLSNPEVQELFAAFLIAKRRDNPQLMAVSVEPNDALPWCECEQCRAMDDPDLKTSHGGGVSAANRVCAFNNIVARKVQAVYPELKLTWYAYHQHTEIPTLVKKLEGAPIVWAAAFNVAYSDWHRDLEDPSSEPNSRFLATLKGYPPLGAELLIYEYFTGYAWLGPMPILGMITDRMRNYRKYGAVGVYCMPVGNWGGQGNTMYLTVKMMWNPDLDVQKEMDLYYTNYFGPAALPMKRYYETMERAVPSGPLFISGGYMLDRFFTDEMLAALNPLIDEARALVKDKAPYEKRFADVAAAHRIPRGLRVFENQKKMPTASGRLIHWKTLKHS
ncbi:MAG: DUF4838 domain-containing protein [Spirochaetota bacterium]